MYVPPKFSLDDDEAWQIVIDAGAGMLVVAAASELASVFVPVGVSDDRRSMQSHLAKANPWWKSVRDGSDILALFLAASAYVSPSNYPSRSDNPDVVPTWNYVTAEVRGRVTLHHDTEWKLHQVRAVTRHFERGQNPEWRVDDMDGDYRERQLRAIVGIEIDVVAIEGKAKLSQNRPDGDRRNVSDHLAAGSLAEQIVAQRMKAID